MGQVGEAGVRRGEAEKGGSLSAICFQICPVPKQRWAAAPTCDLPLAGLAACLLQDILGLIIVKELVLVDENAGVAVKDLRLREVPFIRWVPGRRGRAGCGRVASTAGVRWHAKPTSCPCHAPICPDCLPAADWPPC